MNQTFTTTKFSVEFILSKKKDRTAGTFGIPIAIGTYLHIQHPQLLSTFVSFGKPTPGRFNARVINFAPPWRGRFTIALRSVPLANKDSSFKKSIFQKRGLCECIPSRRGRGGFHSRRTNSFLINNTNIAIEKKYSRLSFILIQRRRIVLTNNSPGFSTKTISVAASISKPLGVLVLVPGKYFQRRHHC